MGDFSIFGARTAGSPAATGGGAPSHRRHHWREQEDGARRPPGFGELPPPARDGEASRLAEIGRPVDGWGAWARADAERRTKAT